MLVGPTTCHKQQPRLYYHQQRCMPFSMKLSINHRKRTNYNMLLFVNDIPEEVQLLILSFLDARTLLARVALVSREWRVLAQQSLHDKLPSSGRIPFENGFQLRKEVIKYNSLGKGGDNDQLWEYFATTFGIDIGEWNVSQVTDFGGVFEGQHDFNRDIGKWDTSNAISMVAMFAYASSFNQDISRWNTGKVRQTSVMFLSAVAFNQDLSRWNMSQVKYMPYMFADAAAFHSDLSNWNIANVLHSDRIFQGATAFDVEQHSPRWENDACDDFNDSFIGF
mmetsp:Transcript_1549/g.2374  ORF Transcript_1549/g.2374 Transcript_1549/m.2374 type:complete len:279 (-) Transcript_1549:86-922(-)